MSVPVPSGVAVRDGDIDAGMEVDFDVSFVGVEGALSVAMRVWLAERWSEGVAGRLVVVEVSRERLMDGVGVKH
jgi:hypothetical protein